MKRALSPLCIHCRQHRRFTRCVCTAQRVIIVESSVCADNAVTDPLLNYPRSNHEHMTTVAGATVGPPLVGFKGSQTQTQHVCYKKRTPVDVSKYCAYVEQPPRPMGSFIYEVYCHRRRSAHSGR